MKSGADLPITVLNGSPGYINLLDAVNAWQLVRELKQLTGLPEATSFKHVSPSGTAVAVPLTDVQRKIYFVDDLEISPLAESYARARGVDRMSSFGDFIALSDKVDVPTARVIALEVSDGVIAPDYEPAALDILRVKKGGKYAVIQIDPTYEPDLTETRDVFGITFEQRRHDRLVSEADFSNMVTENKDLPIENIDIGGVTLIRAAAKNHERVTLVCDPSDYNSVLSELRSGGIAAATRKHLSVKGFKSTAHYDTVIVEYLNSHD